MNRSEVVHEFAQAVIERDHAQAYALTTKGLQARMSLVDFVRVLEDAESGIVPPGRFQIETNPITFEELARLRAERSTPFPPDIRPENFRKWVCIAFQPGPEDDSDIDACYDFWCMLSEENGRERIAYFEIHEPD